MKQSLKMTYSLSVKCIFVKYLQFFTQALLGPNKKVFIKDRYDLTTLDKLPSWVQEKCSCAAQIIGELLDMKVTPVVFRGPC